MKACVKGNCEQLLDTGMAVREEKYAKAILLSLEKEKELMESKR